MGRCERYQPYLEGTVLLLWRAIKGDGKAKVANPTISKVYKDGVEAVLSAYNVNGNNYSGFVIWRGFCTSVTWDGALNTIVIDTSKGMWKNKQFYLISYGHIKVTPFRCQQ